MTFSGTTTVQNLKQAIEQRLQRLMGQNPLRADFQRHYEEIVAEYNREKDRVTVEKTFEALLKFVQRLDEEDSRAVRVRRDLFDDVTDDGWKSIQWKRNGFVRIVFGVVERTRLWFEF